MTKPAQNVANTPETEPPARPIPLIIGVFDSGVGGLTVLAALRRRLPQARYLYLGDTARLPYGSKSQTVIARYAVESTRFLVEQGAHYLVIACNTASALALDAIRSAVGVPVLGVIETGVEAARARSRSRHVLVLATTATVASHAYAKSLALFGLQAYEKACPLLVPLVEEGWTLHPVTREVLRIYLSEALAEALPEAPAEAPDAARSAACDSGSSNHPGSNHPGSNRPGSNRPDSNRADTIVLGCTHYPLLREAIEELAPAGMAVIDSAEVTAASVAHAVEALWMEQYASKQSGPSPALASRPAEPFGAAPPLPPAIGFYATDAIERFRSLGSRFLGEPIASVTLIDLGG